MQRPGVTAAEEQALKNPLACSAFPVIPFPRDQTKNFLTILCWLQTCSKRTCEQQYPRKPGAPCLPFPYQGVLGSLCITHVEWMLQAWKSAPRGEQPPCDAAVCAAHPHRTKGNLTVCYFTALLLFLHHISIFLSLCLLVFGLIITSALFNLLEELISRNKQLAIEKCLSSLYIHIILTTFYQCIYFNR